MDKLNALSTSGKALVVIGAMAFVLAVFYFLMIDPLQDEVASAKRSRTQAQKKAKDLQKYKDDKQITESQGQADELNQQIDRFNCIFPKKEQIPKLIDQIYMIARKRRLEIKRFVPRDLQPDHYVHIKPIEVEVKGKFKDVLQFFRDLSEGAEEAAPKSDKKAAEAAQECARLLTVHDFSFSALPIRESIDRDVARSLGDISTPSRTPGLENEAAVKRLEIMQIRAQLDAYKAAAERAAVEASFQVHAYVFTGRPMNAAEAKLVKDKKRKRRRRR